MMLVSRQLRAIGLLPLLGATLSAAPVTWDAPSNISGDADVQNIGTTVLAYDWKSAAQTVNEVAFTAPGSGATLAWPSGSTHGAFVADAGTALPAYGLSAGYKNILNGGRYANNGAPCTVTLNNLVPGRNYLVQLWVMDARTYGPGRSETITSGGNTVTLSYSNAATNTAGGMGQYSIGHFTADASTQVITLTGNASTQLNALQLRDLTDYQPSGPVVTQPPQSRTVTPGAAVSFSAAATGTAPFTYQWLFKGNPLDGQTNSTLNLANITADQAGDYKVKVTNAVSSATSEAAQLKVVDAIDPEQALEVYNPVWTSPSQNDRGSMPLGNGEVGLMLWVEADGDLQFYLSRTDSRTEIDRLVKLGKVRLNLSPNPFATGKAFRQELRLRDGRAEITAGPPEQRVTLRVWVDSDQPVVHVDGTSTAPITARASYEIWRTLDYTGNVGSSCIGGSSHPNPYESADVVDASGGDNLTFYHRNAWSCVSYLAGVQFMTPYLADIPDTLANRTFGGRMSLTGSSVSGGNALQGSAPVTSFSLKIATHTAQTATLADWRQQLADIDAQSPVTTALQRTEQWWHNYWNRSWLFIRGDGTPEASAMGKNNLPLRLGADSSGGSLFSGSMARASFYGRVLSDSEIAALATGAPDADVSVTNGLAASWLPGQTSGSICSARFGIGPDLSSTGTMTMSTEGGVSHAKFDGGHLIATDDAGFEPTAGATMEAWIKLDAGEPNNGRLFDKVTPNSQDGYLTDLYPGRALRFLNGAEGASTAGNLLPTGTWVHVVSTRDNATRASALWVNGSRVAQQQPASGEEPEAPASIATRSYVLTKWMSTCGARGNFPMMFNGSLWTVNPNTNPITISNNPDYRNWDHAYFYQNTRLPYLSMAARGEVDFMQPFFSYYDRFQALNRGRAVAWHGASTQGQFNNEMTTTFGLTPGGIYGYNRSGLPNWYTNNRYGGAVTIAPGLELLSAMLDAYDHTGDTALLQTRILPYAQDLFRFIETRFTGRSGGKILITPVHSVETFHDTTGAMPVVAGMNAVLGRILALPAGTLTTSQTNAFTAFKALTPPLPTQQINGKTVFAPAIAFSNSRQNVEEPEHYATFPFRLCGIGRPNKQLGIDTFEQISLGNNFFRPFTLGGPLYSNSFSGWQQTPMVAALLGRTSDAKRALTSNVRLRNSAYRLPVMWGQIYDAVPDTDHGSNILNTAQLMAFQTMGDEMFLLPAWPKDWDVSFKFHAPKNTTVSGRFRNGVIDQLEVTPASRTKDLILMQDIPLSISSSGSVSGYEAWRIARSSGDDLTPTSAWAADADPDGDHLTHLAEFALGLNPLVADPNPIGLDWVSIGEQRYPRLSVARDPAATGVTLHGESSDNLTDGSWSTARMVVEEDSPGLFRVRSMDPASSTPQRFLRLDFSAD